MGNPFANEPDLYSIARDITEALELSGSLDWNIGALLIQAKQTAPDSEAFHDFYEPLGFSASQVSRLVGFSTYLPPDTGLTVSKGYLGALAVKRDLLTAEDAVRFLRVMSASDFRAEYLGSRVPEREYCTCEKCGSVHARKQAPAEAGA